MSECLQHSAKLLERKTSYDAGCALELLLEASTISPFSEKLLEMKATSLFLVCVCSTCAWKLFSRDRKTFGSYFSTKSYLELCNFCIILQLRKYDEVIQLCERTFDSAKQNSSLIEADCLSADLDSSELMKNSFSLWRTHLIFKSYYYLGKLEEGSGWLEKQEELIAKRYSILIWNNF